MDQRSLQPTARVRQSSRPPRNSKANSRPMQGLLPEGAPFPSHSDRLDKKAPPWMGASAVRSGGARYARGATKATSAGEARQAMTPIHPARAAGAARASDRRCSAATNGPVRRTARVQRRLGAAGRTRVAAGSAGFTIRHADRSYLPDCPNAASSSLAGSRSPLRAARIMPRCNLFAFVVRRKRAERLAGRLERFAHGMNCLRIEAVVWLYEREY